MQHSGGCRRQEEYRDGDVGDRPCERLLQVGFEIEEDRRDKQIADASDRKQAQRHIGYPQIQKIAERLHDHIQTPEKAQQAKAEVFVIDPAQHKARNGKEEHAEKADQHKEQDDRHGFEEELIIQPSVGTVVDRKAVRKALCCQRIGVFYLQNKILLAPQHRFGK